MVAELPPATWIALCCCSLAKISMVAEQTSKEANRKDGCSLAKISMVAEQFTKGKDLLIGCSLAKISMVAEPQNI